MVGKQCIGQRDR